MSAAMPSAVKSTASKPTSRSRGSTSRSTGSSSERRSSSARGRTSRCWRHTTGTPCSCGRANCSRRRSIRSSRTTTGSTGCSSKECDVSGHSKWATIKHQKGAKDKARGKLFAKLIRQVEVAAREGGGDLDSNATLRTMWNKARDASVPIDTIERAIKRGTGELEGVKYESVNYEGYAPNGVAVIVETLTDNRNRPGADIRSIFAKNGGSMAEPGAVSWQFERKGVVILPKSVSEDDLMLVALDAGAEDLADQGDTWQLTSPPQDLGQLRAALEEAQIEFDSADTTMLPSTTVPLSSEGDARKVLHLIDLLEDLDDVQNVYANFDIPDAIIELVEA